MAPKVKPTIGVEAFAVLVGRTRQNIYQLIDKGLPHRRVKGAIGIVPADGVKWLIEYMTWEYQEQSQQPKKGDESIPSEKTERALMTRAARLLKEHELLMATGKAALVDDMRPFMEQLIGTFSGIAAGRLKSYERDMVKCKTMAHARKITDRQHTDLMAGAIAYAEQMEAEADETRAEVAIGKPSLPVVESPKEEDDDDD